MNGIYKPPAFDCADVPRPELRHMGNFVRRELSAGRSLMITYPGAGRDIEVLFVPTRSCRTTAIAPFECGPNSVVVAPLNFRSAILNLDLLPTSAEKCAHLFDCNVHTGADLANLMIAISSDLPEE